MIQQQSNKQNTNSLKNHIRAQSGCKSSTSQIPNSNNQQSKCISIFKYYLKCLLNFMEFDRLYQFNQIDRLLINQTKQYDKVTILSQQYSNSTQQTYVFEDKQMLVPEYFNPFKYKHFSKFSIVPRYCEKYTNQRETAIKKEIYQYMIKDSSKMIKKYFKFMSKRKLDKIIRLSSQRYNHQNQLTNKIQVINLICCYGSGYYINTKYGQILKQQIQRQCLKIKQRQCLKIKQRQLDINKMKQQKNDQLIDIGNKIRKRGQDIENIQQALEQMNIGQSQNSQNRHIGYNNQITKVQPVENLDIVQKKVEQTNQEIQINGKNIENKRQQQNQNKEQGTNNNENSVNQYKGTKRRRKNVSLLNLAEKRAIAIDDSMEIDLQIVKQDNNQINHQKVTKNRYKSEQFQKKDQKISHRYAQQKQEDNHYFNNQVKNVQSSKKRNRRALFVDQTQS